MRVLITGANGFVGRNLQLHLQERHDVQVVCYTRDHQVSNLATLLEGVDFVFHLAGVNRPQDPQEFTSGNADFTRDLCRAVAFYARSKGKGTPILFASSTQATHDNAYGRSKREAEEELMAVGCDHLVPVHIFRLPNVFGKWCRPNYNSVVATFCHNIARNLPIKVNDAQAALTLVYIDDVIERFIQIMDDAQPMTGNKGFATVQPQYISTVGELARLIRSFKDSRTTLMTERVGSGLLRALYATYVSYLPAESFVYTIPQYADQRGVFVEMLKTPDCGQFSYFTLLPGGTRGGHYHHTKTEKFLVIKGEARFKFRHMYTLEEFELVANGDLPTIIETVPGWTHDITNIGGDEIIVMLWANEVFDHVNPDTYACPL